MALHSLFSLHLPKPSPLHLLRASSAATVQSPSQSLEERFGRKGIKFSESGYVPTVEFTVRNRSSLRLRIADGIFTYYRPKVYWKDDGFEEVLYTIGDEASSVKGGLGLVLNGVSRDGSAWSASKWSVKDADSDSIDAVQQEVKHRIIQMLPIEEIPGQLLVLVADKQGIHLMIDLLKFPAHAELNLQFLMLDSLQFLMLEIVQADPLGIVTFINGSRVMKLALHYLYSFVKEIQ